jgi:hypothetical protein
MTPITITKTGTGRSAVMAPDSFQNPFNVGVLVTVTGTATYNIEFSMDDPMTAAPTVWAVASGFSAATASASGSLTVPCHAISINVTSGTGTVTAQIVQAGVR